MSGVRGCKTKSDRTHNQSSVVDVGIPGGAHGQNNMGHKEELMWRRQKTASKLLFEVFLEAEWTLLKQWQERENKEQPVRCCGFGDMAAMLKTMNNFSVRKKDKVKEVLVVIERQKVNVEKRMTFEVSRRDTSQVV